MHIEDFYIQQEQLVASVSMCVFEFVLSGELLIGVAMAANKKTLFVSLMGPVYRFQAH